MKKKSTNAQNVKEKLQTKSEEWANGLLQRAKDNPYKTVKFKIGDKIGFVVKVDNFEWLGKKRSVVMSYYNISSMNDKEEKEEYKWRKFYLKDDFRGIVGEEEYKKVDWVNIIEYYE